MTRSRAAAAGRAHTNCYTSRPMQSEAPEDSQHSALIVEDDPAIRRLVGKLLGRHGIAYETVSNGREAIESLRRRHYSVLVLDLMVPEANGFEVIEVIKQENMKVPVAVVSAVSHQALTKLDLDIVKLVISKPFDVDEFSKAIVALCKEGM